MLPRLEELLAAGPAAQEINHAFWQACHGGQRRAAERLLDAGADLAYHPDYATDTPAQIAASVDTRRSNLVEWLSQRAAQAGTWRAEP